MLDAGFSTLVYLKSRLLPDAGIDETQWDTALGKLGLAVAARINAHCNRGFDRSVHDNQFVSGASTLISLRRFPAESIGELVIVEMNGSLTLITSADYAFDKPAGLMELLAPLGDRTQQLRVTYTGGFWLDPMDESQMPDGATVLPDDLLEAWISEIQIQAEARNLFGAVSLRKDSTKSKPATGLDESTVEALRTYRRFSGE